MQRYFNLEGFNDTWWWWLGFAVAAAVLIYILYRVERPFVRPGVGWTLVTLRLLVIVVLLIVLLEPTTTMRWAQSQSGRILIAFDLSDSMDSTDAHATNAEKFRWARGLGILGNAGTNARLDNWQKALDAGRQPEWVEPNETDDPERRVRLARSRQQNFQSALAEVDKLPRRKIAERLLLSAPGGLKNELAKLGELQYMVFAGKSETVDEKQLGLVLFAPPNWVNPTATNLAGALQPPPGGEKDLPVMGIVIFTDGRDNSDRDPLALARRLGLTGARIFPVVLGSTTPPKDLSIRLLDYPETVFKNDKAVLKVLLRTAGFQGETIEVSLEQKDKPPDVRTIAVEGSEANIEFELDAKTVGRQDFTFKIKQMPGETRTDNNSSQFSFTVVEDKVSVLLVEGEARWEFRFIDTALKRDTRVNLLDVVFRQPHIGRMAEGFFPASLDWKTGAEVEASPSLALTDMLVIGDVSPGELPEEAWKLVDKFVAESGGTLILCAGKDYMPASHTSPILNQLLPVQNLRPAEMGEGNQAGSPTERGFRLRLTPEGEQESMLQFDTEPQANRQIWDALPGHSWGLFGEAKPGATVLAVARQTNLADLAAERRSAVIAVQQYGLGQVLWLGIDSTWRWRFRAGDKYHHRFWGQLARWAANNKAAAGNEFVRFGADKGDVEEHEDLLIRARWMQSFLKKFPQVRGEAQIVRDGQTEPTATVALKPSTARPAIHEGRISDLPPGQYRVKLAVRDADMGGKTAEFPLYVQKNRPRELADLSADAELLRQVAHSSRGELIYPDQVDLIPKLLKPPEISASQSQTFRYWNHPLVLALLLTLLGLEWVLRKTNGLP